MLQLKIQALWALRRFTPFTEATDSTVRNRPGPTVGVNHDSDEALPDATSGQLMGIRDRQILDIMNLIDTTRLRVGDLRGEPD